MTKLNDNYLKRLLELHPDGDIHATVLDLMSHLADLEQETDSEKTSALTGTVRDLAAVLEHELHENGRTSEDYVNDGVFHARS